MKITDIIVKEMSFRRRKVFKIAFTASMYARGVYVKLLTDEGISGMGEACPMPFVTGETIGGVMAAIEHMKGALLGADPEDPAAIHAIMDRQIAGNSAAKAAIDAAINAAIEAGVSNKWNGQRPPIPAICVHDGDGARPSDGAAFGQECKGHWVFTASCKADRPPFVVDGMVQKIINPAEVYSGCYANVNVNFFAYNQAGKKGIGCGLNGIQKTRDGEPLGSTVTAEEAFSAIPQAGMPAPAPAAPSSWGTPAPTGWATT